MLEKFERYPLMLGITPIEKLERLTEYLGGDVEIYTKREDCNSGLAFGGNKIRKLEYIIPDAISSGADTLVTIGGVQSNSCCCCKDWHALLFDSGELGASS